MDVLYAVSFGLGILKVLFDVHVCLYHGDTGQFYVSKEMYYYTLPVVIAHKKLFAYPCLMNPGATNLTSFTKDLVTTRKGIHCEKSEERKKYDINHDMFPS